MRATANALRWPLWTLHGLACFEAGDVSSACGCLYGELNHCGTRGHGRVSVGMEITEWHRT